MSMGPRAKLMEFDDGNDVEFQVVRVMIKKFFIPLKH